MQRPEQRQHVGLPDRTHGGFHGRLQFFRAFQFPGTFIAPLAVCLAGAILVPSHAAQPSLQPLVKPGQWPEWPRGFASGVPLSGNCVSGLTVSGNYAYLAASEGGLGGN